VEKETLICNSSNITYSKGYIVLWLDTYPLPEKIEVDEVTLLKKDHFHVTIYTLQSNMGIGLNSKSDMEQKSVSIEIPEAVTIVLLH